MVRDAIDGERYFLSPRMKQLKSMLAKLDPRRQSAPSRPFHHQSTRRSAARRGKQG